MALVPADLAHDAPASPFAHLVELLRSIPHQVRLALGTRGVVLASAAGLVGLACCVIAFIDVVLALHTPAVQTQTRVAKDMRVLDQAALPLMRSLHMINYGVLSPDQGSGPLRGAWMRFEDVRTATCSNEALGSDVLRGGCAALESLSGILGPEIAAFSPPARPLDRRAVARAITQYGLFNQLRVEESRNAELLMDDVIDRYASSLVILTLCTIGFAGAGLMLILLVGRTSMLHHDQLKHVSEARELLQETIDAMPVGLVVYDQQERLVLHNSAAVVATPLLGTRNVIGMTHEEIARASYELRAKSGEPLTEGPEAWIARFRSKGTKVNRRSQQGRWFEWSEKAAPSGRTIGLRIDVTDRRLHELELERSQAEYRDLVDSLSDVVYKIDVGTGEFTFVSAASAELFGVPPDKLRGQRATGYVAPDDLEYVMGRVRAHLQAPEGEICQLQYQVRLPDGRHKYIETRFRKVRGEEGKALIAGVARDIDERVRMAERLKIELARLHSIVSSSGAMILVADRSLNITMVNSEFTAVTGIDEAIAVGRPLKEVVNCPLDPSIIEDWLSAPLPPGRAEPVRFTNRVWDPQGRERIISVTVTPSADTRGRVEGFVFLGVDDTERRAAEEALFDTERLATMGEMASTLAHEIAQPLQVINIATSAIQDELDETAESGRMLDREYLAGRTQRIAAQVERASRIIGEVRAFVRGTSQDQAAPFEIAAAVQGAVDLTSHAAHKAGLAVSLALGDQLPGVSGHIGRLEQVLVNLINNARDAGARAVTVAAEAARQDGRSFVRITIDDNGPGIAVDVLPRLFQTFITTKPRGLGTGFGLRICRRIIEEMGGTISAGNGPAGGARFEILLPAAAP